tara:strand:- start:1625 stop:2518 length:894 start_codon:yes stop_codon:yes gene_type:complete
MANDFSKTTKSNRLLQSLRYTLASTDNTEAYTSVLDLNASEIYTQQNLIPSISLPYSGSSQHLDFITSSVDSSDVNIAQYYFRVTMSRSSATFGNNKSEAWLAISGSGYDPVSINNSGGVNTQTINSLQLTDWISNKYILASDAGLKAEGDPPGYNIQLYIDGVSTTAGFQFDYKTGILQFESNAVSPSITSKVAVSGYRYVGQTLDDFISTGGDSQTTFPFTGSALITGSLGVTGSMSINATSNNINDIFLVKSGSIDLFKVSSSGAVVFGDLELTPEPVIGGMFYSSSFFYVGIE